MYSDRRGYGQKPPRTKPSRQKTPGQKPLDKSPREQLRENLYRGLLSGFFVLGLLKIGGSEMCDVLLGGSRDVWQSVTGGRGGQNWPKIAWHTLWMAPNSKDLRVIDCKSVTLRALPVVRFCKISNSFRLYIRCHLKPNKCRGMTDKGKLRNNISFCRRGVELGDGKKFRGRNF